jgi:3-hydroxyacyl-[acyl-carrier-protein] dehydratase
MLKDHLYSIENLELGENIVNAHIRLNPDHPIFKGHFPDVPVLPGVSMMQMVKEIMEEALKRSFLLRSASQMKFLQMLNPKEVAQVDFTIDFQELEEGAIKLKAQMHHKEVVYFKISAQLI